jgi:drug/metabolite transporter (DMT)-like permease
VLGERVAPLQWLGVAVSFAGVTVIACRGEPAAFAALSFNVGDLFALGSMAMWAAYTVTLQRRRDRLETAQFLLVIALIGLVTLLPWVAWELASDARARLTPPGLAALLYSAVGSFLLAYLGWGYAVKRLGAGRTGAWMHLMPAIGVGLAAAFLGEYPSWFHFAGIALILAGVGLSQLRASSPASSR